MTRRSYTNFVERLTAIGLLAEVEARTLKKHVTLLDLYKGHCGRGSSTAAARRAVYKWLMSEGKSINEVARLFDRAPSGVFKLTQGTK